jgi:hypothetical protein
VKANLFPKVAWMAVVVFLFPAALKSQFSDETQEWFGVYANAKLKEIVIRSDAQLRYSGLDNFKTALVRVGIKKYFGKQFYVCAGPSFFYYGRNVQGKTAFEWRPWEEAGIDKDFQKLKFRNRLRLEQRWLISGGDVRFLSRLRLLSELFFKMDALGKKAGFILSNELLVQKEKATAWYWEHDRVTAGLQFFLSDAFGLQVQYIYMPFVRRNADSYIKRQVLRVNLLLEF